MRVMYVCCSGGCSTTAGLEFYLERTSSLWTSAFKIGVSFMTPAMPNMAISRKVHSQFMMRTVDPISS